MAEGTSGFSSVTDTNVVLDPWIVKSVRALSRSKASPERGHPITRALDDTNTRLKASVWTFLFRVHRQERAYRLCTNQKGDPVGGGISEETCAYWRLELLCDTKVEWLANKK